MIFLKKKKLVFFPIESTSRELEIRRVLAQQLTLENNVYVIIIEQQLLRILSNFISNSIYFGKHFFSKPAFHDTFHYDLIKRRGNILFYLHEEGVFPGTEESWVKFMLNMMRPSIFQKDDYLLLWSEWQKEHIQKSYNLLCKVEVTGHPRFDLYKTLIKSKKEYKFLINTSFSYPNHIQGFKFIFSGKNKSYNFIKDSDLIFNNYFSQSECIIWIERLVFELSKLYPSELIIIRPHPSENEFHYKNLFMTLKNVKIIKDELIGDALSKTEALIQIGCTTAIESYLSGVPTFTNKNIGSSRAEISNDLSINLSLPIDEDSSLFKKRIVDKKIIDKHSYLTLANLDSKYNSINKITNLISTELKARKSFSFPSLILRVYLALNIYFIIYWPFKFLYYLFTNNLKALKDFKSRYKPGKKHPKSIRFSKYIEIFH
tara:strand:- start:1093 stop:2385 length:1293 start_codon:yes stop_codon:yes gene_type:complete